MTVYSDLNIFSPHSKPLIEDVESVVAAVSNILQTRRNSRLFNLEIESNIESLLFEPLTDTNASVIYDRIFRSISRFEPRVNLLNSSTVSVNNNEDGYDVFLAFTVEGFEGEYSIESSLGALS